MDAVVSSLPQSTAAWHRRVWMLAAPAILANLSVPLMGLVNTGVMGHQPDPAYVGGVGIAAIVFDFLYWGFGFLRMSTTGLIAQAVGANDSWEVRATLLRALFLAAVFAVLILLVQTPVLALAFAIIRPETDVAALAQQYFAIRIWAAPATLANYVILGLLIGAQRPLSALLVQVLANGTNIALSLLLVLRYKMGIAGVGLASLAAELVGLLVGLWLVRQYLTPAIPDRRRLLDWRAFLALAAMNANIMIRTLCLVSSFAAFTALSARMGKVPLAANTLLIHMQAFMAYGLDGFAHAAEALVGSALGARSPGAVRRAVVVSTQWAFGVAVLFALAYGVGGMVLIGTLTDLENVRAEAFRFLPWVVVLPLVSVWSYQLDGIFIGATHTAEMRNAMIGAALIYVASLAVLVPLWANHGLWLALVVFMLARATLLGAYYKRIEVLASRPRP